MQEQKKPAYKAGFLWLGFEVGHFGSAEPFRNTPQVEDAPSTCTLFFSLATILEKYARHEMMPMPGINDGAIP